MRVIGISGAMMLANMWKAPIKKQSLSKEDQDNAMREQNRKIQSQLSRCKK